jgi:hypothetical protein
MLGRAALVRTDVSEEFSASFIRVTRIGELRTTLAVTSNRRTLRSVSYGDDWFFLLCVSVCGPVYASVYPTGMIGSSCCVYLYVVPSRRQCIPRWWLVLHVVCICVWSRLCCSGAFSFKLIHTRSVQLCSLFQNFNICWWCQNFPCHWLTTWLSPTPIWHQFREWLVHCKLHETEYC